MASFGDILYNFTGAGNWADANRQAQQQGMGALLDPGYWGKVGMGTLQTGSLLAAPLRGVSIAARSGAGLLGGAKTAVTSVGSDLLGTWPRRILTGLGITGAAAASNPASAAAPMSNTTPSGTTGRVAPSLDSILRSWDQTRLASILMGVNPSLNAPTLTPSELEYFAQKRRDVQRGAGQAAATNALQEKQAREEYQRQLAAINSYMAAAPQDVATTTTALGPAAELGYSRTLEREGAASTQAAKQNLQDFLAREKLAASQRGANVSAALSDISMAQAATAKEKADAFNKFLTQQLGLGR